MGVRSLVIMESRFKSEKKTLGERKLFAIFLMNIPSLGQFS